MVKISNVNLEFVVATPNYNYKESDLKKYLIFAPNHKYKSVGIYFDTAHVGYVSKKDKMFVFNTLRQIKDKNYLINEWNVVYHTPHYIVINANIESSKMWKIWIYQLKFNDTDTNTNTRTDTKTDTKTESYIGSTKLLPTRINQHKTQL